MKNLILLAGSLGTTRESLENAQKFIIEYFGTRCTKKHENLPVVYIDSEIKSTDITCILDSIDEHIYPFVVVNYDSQQVQGYCINLMSNEDLKK